MIPEQDLLYSYSMRFIVTGGMGFIGSHFVDLLLANNHQVLLVDKLTYAANPLNLSQDVQNEANFRKIDISDAPSLNECVQNFGNADCIVNFAAESHVDRSIENTLPFLESNIKGTINLLELLRSGAAKKMIQVSTDEVYGSLDTGSWDEGSNLDPRSPYSASKASAEMMCNAYRNTFGLQVIVTRCANNFGPRQSVEKFIPLAISSILKGDKIPIYGDGLNRREWIHVRDHCLAIYTLATTEKAKFDIYNVGGKEFTNLEIAEALSKVATGTAANIGYVKDRLGHDFRYSVNDQRIRSEFNWEPILAFENAIGETIDWYRSNPEWIKESRKRVEK
jgi:dTDP-glucose 4,6-dehydratase